MLNRSTGVNLDELIDFLVTRKPFLRPEQIHRIQGAFSVPVELPSAPQQERLSAEFDFLAEVQTQINAVQILRNRVIDNDQLADGVSVRDAKEALSAATSLITTLNKVYQDIVNANRLRQVEMAVIDTVKKFPEVHKEFLALLKSRLESVE